MNVASIVVETLIANGVDQLYCLPGVQNDPFFDALHDRTDALTPVQTRHEQGAAYMATGAALATGRPQAFCVVPGPGFLNATAALATAWATNAPVLALVGQIPLGAVGKGYGLLHEIPDQLGIIKGLTKQAKRISGGGGAHAVLQSAFAALLSGRPRPVGVEVPANVWSAELPETPAGLVSAPQETPAVDEEAAARAAALLSSAERPLIVVGGGARNFSEEITRLAETLSAPVLSFRNGKGVVSADNPLSIGMPVAHDLWNKVDVVLGLGTRLSQRMPWGVDDGLKIVHVDIDPEEIRRFDDPDLAVNADLADALPALLDALEGREIDRRDWLAEAAATKNRFAAVYADRLAPQMAWLNAIRAELPRDGIFVDELTQMGYVSRFAFDCYAPRTFISTGYQGTLGYGFATALGAAHARRDVPVVAISGDGGALFAIGEMATAVHHRIPLTTVIFNDNAFGNVRLLQKEHYGGRFIASDLTSPDFARLAESFGARGLRAATPKELRMRLREAFGSQEPTLIEVPVGELPSPWEFLMMPKVRGK